MFESRSTTRYSSLARAQIAGLAEGEALLMDLSVTGCRLEFSAAVAFDRSRRYRIQVLPESPAKIEEFILEAEPRWSRADYDYFDIGFAIVASPKGKALLRYIDYLAWRSETSGSAV